MIETFVINLKERPDRKTHIIKELKKCNCDDYTMIEAINGWKENKEDYELSCSMSKGAMGCYLSHFKSLETLTEEYGVVFEDDIEIMSDDLYKDIKELKENLPSDWEVCFLGSTPLYLNKWKDKVGEVEEVNLYCKKVCGVNFGSNYIIKKSALEKMKKFPIKAPIDTAFRVWNMNCYLADPPIIRHLPRMISNTQRPI